MKRQFLLVVAWALVHPACSGAGRGPAMRSQPATHGGRASAVSGGELDADRPHGRDLDPEAPSEVRGASIEHEPVDVWLGLRVNDVPVGSVGSGRVVRSGDRLQLELIVAEPSHIYLGYCSTSGKLDWYPRTGALLAKPDEPLVVPSPRAALVMDDRPGLETIYVVVSQRELTQADRELAAAIERNRQEDSRRDCAAPLAKPATGETHVASRAVHEARVDVLDRASKPVGLVRGGYIRMDDLERTAVRVDAEGIAIVRYTFRHIAMVR